MTISKLFISLELQCNYNYSAPEKFLCLQRDCWLCLQEFHLPFTSISEHLLGYIVYSFDIFCSSNHVKVRKVAISEIWIRGRLTRFMDSEGKVKARSRQGQGKVRARSRQDQDKVRTRPR